MTGRASTGSGTASGGAGSGAARRPSRRDSEDLSKSGGWTRDESGNLVPPGFSRDEHGDLKKTPTEPETPSETAPHTQSQQTKGARSGSGSRGKGRRPGRSVSVGPATVPLPGTPAGVLLALVLYPAGLAALKGGPAGLKNWFNAKFFNKTPGSAGAANSAWAAPSASAASAVNAAYVAAGGGASSTNGSSVATAAFSTGGGSATVAPVIAYALAQVGKAYVWAGSGPNGFDCSGLTMKAYQQIGVTLPHSSALQAVMGTKVASISESVAGDLVFPYWPVTHVALHLGGGRLVEAGNPSTGVRTTNFYGAAGGIRRIVT